MISDALSNAAYRVSLRGPGAEIEGGSQQPPAGGGKSRGPAGRGCEEVSGYGQKYGRDDVITYEPAAMDFIVFSV